MPRLHSVGARPNQCRASAEQRGRATVGLSGANRAAPAHSSQKRTGSRRTCSIGTFRTNLNRLAGLPVVDRGGAAAAYRGGPARACPIEVQGVTRSEHGSRGTTRPRRFRDSRKRRKLRCPNSLRGDAAPHGATGLQVSRRIGRARAIWTVRDPLSPGPAPFTGPLPPGRFAHLCRCSGERFTMVTAVYARNGRERR